jgi:hypothetical protein
MISLHVIEESMVTGLSQALAENETMGPNEQFLAPEGVTGTTVVGQNARNARI